MGTGTGHRKSSAALLIVCEHIFLLLGADYSSADQVRTKDDELLKRVLLYKQLKKDFFLNISKSIHVGTKILEFHTHSMKNILMVFWIAF